MNQPESKNREKAIKKSSSNSHMLLKHQRASCLHLECPSLITQKQQYSFLIKIFLHICCSSKARVYQKNAVVFSWAFIFQAFASAVGGVILIVGLSPGPKLKQVDAMGFK